MTRQGVSQSRANYKLRLAAHWVALRRPDVFKAIEEETDRKFPRVRARKTDLPLTIRGIK
jgi:hypothetical protein